MLFMLKHLRQICVFQSSIAKQHRIAINRVLAQTENVNVHLDGTPKLTVQVSTKISKLRAYVSTGNSCLAPTYFEVTSTTGICEAQNSIEQMAPAVSNS